MAAAKKKKSARNTGSRASGAKKRKTSAAKGRSSRSKTSRKPAFLGSRIFLVCIILLSMALSLITMFHFGAAGKIMFGLLSLLMGSFAWIFLICIIAFGFWIIWTGCKNRLPARFWIGLLLMMAGWGMAAALPNLPSSDPWLAFVRVTQSWQQVLLGGTVSYCGIIGAFLAGFFCSLFSVEGSWIIAVLLLILSAVLVGWSVLGEAMRIMKQNSREAISSLNEKVRENRRLRKEQAEAAENEEPEAPAPFSLEAASMLLDDASESGGKPAPKKARQKSVFSFLQNLDLFEDEPSDPAAQKDASDSLPDDLFEHVRISGAFDEPSGKDGQPSFLTEDLSLSKIRSEESSSGESRKKTASSSRKKAASKPASRKSQDKPAEHEPGSETQKTPEQLIAESASRKSVQPELPADADDPFVLNQNWPVVNYDNYRLPKISLLNDAPRSSKSVTNIQQAKENGTKLISILKEFNVPAVLTEIHIGPSVTKFEISPGVGVRVNTITNLQNDIKMALAATDIRIEAPIPGKSAVGIEVPNPEKTEVCMKELMKNVPEKLSRLPLVFALGKDLLGENVYGRLDTMPHLLIAGATGSGKSVCVNSIISSILMRTRPDEVKMILVDPKKVEFTPYNDVPHLLAPVITDGDLANKALKVVVEMMDARYDLFEEARVRNINSFNAFVDQNPDTHLKRLPRIVVIIDELADLMLVAAKEVEQSIQRITQLARAAGIHLIVATQRPSVNVITGVIKANIPSRIAFAVSSSVDSRTILDQAGAERLLGYGDMLFLDNGETAPRRIQGVFIKDEEVNAIAEYVKSQAQPQYDDAFITLRDLQSQGGSVGAEPDDPLYDQIKHFVITQRKASTSLIQRRFSIGYARAARVMDSLEINGIIGPANGSKPREILVQMNYEDE